MLVSRGRVGWGAMTVKEDCANRIVVLTVASCMMSLSDLPIRATYMPRGFHFRLEGKEKRGKLACGNARPNEVTGRLRLTPCSDIALTGGLTAQSCESVPDSLLIRYG